MNALSHMPVYLLQTIAWVLIHALWQGTVAAIAYRLCRLLTTSPAVRHGVGHACLALFLASQLITLAFAADQSQRLADVIASTGTPKSTPLTLRGWNRFAELPSLEPSSLVLQLEPVLPWLANAWCAVLTIQMAWMIVLMTSLSRELRRCVEVGGQLRARLLELAARIPGCEAVRFLESKVISVPGTAGWLRPVVLMPIGWAWRVPPQQVEAIILHELAHVARQDYLTSVLRSFVRSLYFFHLPLRWMLHALNGDAEQAADDVAATALGDPHAYANALLELEAGRSASPLLLGADGGSLRKRFHHLMVTRSRRARRFSSIVGTMTAGFTALLLLGYGAAGAAIGHSEGRWLESHDLTSSVFELLTTSQANPNAEAMLARVHHQTTPDRATLLALAREMQRGFSPAQFRSELGRVALGRSLLGVSLATYGTTVDRRRVVNQFLAIANESTGTTRRDAARAAVLLAATDVFDFNGVRCELLILNPMIRDMLDLPPAAAMRLEHASAMHHHRMVRAVHLLGPLPVKKPLDAPSFRELQDLLVKLPALKRSLFKQYPVLRAQFAAAGPRPLGTD